MLYKPKYSFNYFIFVHDLAVFNFLILKLIKSLNFVFQLKYV